jgi:hypothetical protein
MPLMNLCIWERVAADAPRTKRIDEVWTDPEVNHWAFTIEDLLSERSRERTKEAEHYCCKKYEGEKLLREIL